MNNILWNLTIKNFYVIFKKTYPHIRLSGGKDRKRESARHTCLFIFNQEGWHTKLLFFDQTQTRSNKCIHDYLCCFEKDYCANSAWICKWLHDDYMRKWEEIVDFFGLSLFRDTIYDSKLDQYVRLCVHSHASFSMRAYHDR